MTTQPPLWLPGWDIEPCDTAPPSRRPRTDAATRLRELREHRIEPEAGRAAGGKRQWTPIGDDIRITTIKPNEEYL